MSEIFESRKNFSTSMLTKLRGHLQPFEADPALKEVCVYATGSLGRLEACQHSDLDVFRISETSANRSGDISSTDSLLEAIKYAAADLGFPPLTDDGKYLRTIDLAAMLKALGQSADDSENHFTARMLLLLESKPVMNSKAYDAVLSRVLDRYYKDFEDHSNNFRAIFLLNDIMRYWKTLCMNYEAKRNAEELGENKKSSLRVKNFKLKFSRLWTCFSLVIPVSAKLNVSKEELKTWVKMTPRERLETVATNSHRTDLLEIATAHYGRFLSHTDADAAELANKLEGTSRNKMFQDADSFGRSMFDLLSGCAQADSIRFLVM